MPTGQRFGVNIMPGMYMPAHIVVDSKPRPRQIALPQEQVEAYSEWGGPSQFDSELFPESDFGVRFQVVGEIAPLTKTLLQRVENADDPSQFVDVERYKSITFRISKRNQEENGLPSRKIKLEFDTSRFDG
jgi:hypothetical protein